MIMHAVNFSLFKKKIFSHQITTYQSNVNETTCNNLYEKGGGVYGSNSLSTIKTGDMPFEPHG